AASIDKYECPRRIRGDREAALLVAGKKLSHFLERVAVGLASLHQRRRERDGLSWSHMDQVARFAVALHSHHERMVALRQAEFCRSLLVRRRSIHENVCAWRNARKFYDALRRHECHGFRRGLSTLQ